ncbi:hypothetical protein N0V95_007473 [Ascochyta clinopodiicola]|nr:hypothetical protein N0V95_007473 [Ascochyta clinopodiicola]
MGEVVPYILGMQQGQGYNTYLQQLCVKDAVTIQPSEKPGNPFRREYTSELVEDYEKLAKSMKISAGAAVSGWGQSGNVNVSILDRSEIETENPNETYGDCFITDFVRGGHFFARVSITACNSSETRELKQSSSVKITIIESTGPDKGSASGSGLTVKAEETSDLMAVKAKADKFYEDANSGKHNYVLL